MSTEYLVCWEMEIEADGYEEAARKAVEIMRDPDSIADVFTVMKRSDIYAPWGPAVKVDLHPEEGDGKMFPLRTPEEADEQMHADYVQFHREAGMDV